MRQTGLWWLARFRLRAITAVGGRVPRACWALLASICISCVPVTAYAGSVVLTWQPPTTNTDGSPLTDLSSYRVSWRCGSGAGYPNSVTVPAPASGHTLNGLPDVGTCRFVVAAFNSVGAISDLSNEAQKNMGALQAPGQPGLSVTWAESTEPRVAISKSFKNAQDGGAGGGSGTVLNSGSFDTTGFTHIVLWTKHEEASTTITPSSTAVSGSWTSKTKASHANGELHGQIHYATLTTFASGQTATMTVAAARTHRVLGVWLVDAESGVIEEDAVAQNTGTGTGFDAGSLVTSGASVVSFMGVGEFASTTHTSAGWTGASGGAEDWEGTTNGNSAGYSRGPETTTPIDPAGSQTANDAWVVNALSLREGAGGGASLRRKGSLSLMGVGR